MELGFNSYAMCLLMISSASLVAMAKESKNNRITPSTEDFIMVENMPDYLSQHFVLKVSYSCSINRTAGLQIYADSDTKLQVRIFERLWHCSETQSGNKTKTRFVKILLPDIVAYQDDWILKKSIVVSNVNVRVWLLFDSNLPTVHNAAFDNAEVKAIYSTQVLPPNARPVKPHKLCYQWYIRHLQKLKEHVIKKCEWQPEVIELVGFPVSFSETNNGISRQLPPYTDNVLIHAARKKHTNPLFTYSMWLFLTEYCQSSLCSIIQRKGFHDNQFLTPLVLLNDEGQIHLQVVQANGVPYSYLPSIQLPLKQWFRLIYTQNGGKWDIYITYGDEHENEIHTGYSFPHGVYINDMDGFIHLGGSEAFVGFSGYMAETRFYRTHVLHPHQIFYPAQTHAMFSIGIEDFYRQCDRFHQHMSVRLQTYHMMIAEYYHKRSCSADFTSFIQSEYAKKSKRESEECSPWQEPTHGKHIIPYGELRQLAAQQITEMTQKHFQDIGRKLYDTAVNMYLEKEGLLGVPKMMVLLKQGSCFGDYKSSYMLSVLYNNGAGVKRSLEQGYLYLLISTLGNYNIALMASGYRHFHGLNGFPQDHDYSFHYYLNVADKSSKDREEHNPDGVYTEHVRLIDKEALDAQRGETGDYFLWLKYQAKHGVGDAKSNLARMLFWGQQGVDRNVDAAVEYYQISAESPDAGAIALYDYGIILLRGQGVERNISKGVEYLHKAAEKGHAPALNALGWHASTIEGDVSKAVHYWEMADELGNKDAAYNLGHLYNVGAYPGEEADPKKAFDKFHKAAGNGHIDGGLVLARLFNQGVKDHVERNVHHAVIWARYIAEQFGTELGVLLKQGVDSYLDQSWSKTYIYYLMAAESGLEVALFNMAFLCEENHDSLVAFIEKECVWHFYNLSTIVNYPHPHALIKMGDFHWYGCRGYRNISGAVDMYTKAALANDPHGLFNLAYLVEEDTDIRESTWLSLGIPNHVYNSSKYTLLKELYHRCRDHNKEESFLPCTLALLRVELINFWNNYNSGVKVVIVGLAVLTCLSIFINLTQRRLPNIMETV